MIQLLVTYTPLGEDKTMDSGTKDSVANLTSAAGMGLTFMDIQSTISILVLITALILNVGRIYEWYKKRSK